MSENMAVQGKWILNLDADFYMQFMQTGFETYGIRYGDEIYIKAWQTDERLFAVAMQGSEDAVIMTWDQLSSLAPDDIAFFGAVVYVGRSLAGCRYEKT